MPDVVYDLWFVREHDDREDTELHIGIYRTQADAEAAIERLRDKEGFHDFPQGFSIYPMTLNMDGWTEGFVTVTWPATPKDAPADRCVPPPRGPKTEPA